MDKLFTRCEIQLLNQMLESYSLWIVDQHWRPSVQDIQMSEAVRIVRKCENATT